MAMSDTIARAPDGAPEAIFAHVTTDLDVILTAKRNDVAWKLRAVQRQFDTEVAPGLAKRRATTDALPAASVVADDGPSSRGASAPTSPPALRNP